MKKIVKYCAYCGKELTSEQRHNTYCSQKCANAAKKQNKINAWLSGENNGNRQNGQLSETIRNYLLEKANYQCELCGWNKVNPTLADVFIINQYKERIEQYHKNT